MKKSKHSGKTLYEPKFMEGVIKQIKDIMCEVFPGFLRGNCIYATVCDVEGMENGEKVNKIYKRIKASITLEWATTIESVCVVKRGESMPEWYVVENRKT